MTLRRRPRTARLAVGAGLIVAAVAAPAASAHSTFLESTPLPGERLATPPSRIVMLYTEPLNARLTRVRLRDMSSGTFVRAAVRVTAGRRLELLPRERLPQGAYRLEWRSVSTIDAHIREGSVGFGVGTAAVGQAVAAGASPLDGVGPLRIAVRWLLYAALFLFAGGALNAALRPRHGSGGAWLTPAHPPRDVELAAIAAVAEGSWRRTVLSAWLATAAAVATVALETADATGGFSPGAWAEFLTTGTAGLSRLGLVGALLGGALVAARAPRAAAAAVVLAFLALALGGHAGGADPRWLAVSTNLVHLIAAALWLGGIAHIAWAWLPALRGEGRSLRRAVVRDVLPRFGQVALPAFVVVAATGLVNALVQLGAASELWSSAYGRVLLLKIALVGAIALISYVHVFRLRPRVLAPAPGALSPERLQRAHRRLLGSEAPIGLVVLAAAAVLVAFPVPPREAEAARRTLGEVKPCDPCPFAAPQAGELAVGTPVGHLTAGAWLRRQGHELVGTLRIIDGKRRPVAAPTRIAGATTTSSCGRGCLRFSLSAKVTTVDLSVDTDRGAFSARLPARWAVSGDRQARRLMARSQRAMRGLGSFSMTERVRSAEGLGREARTDFRFQAPNRMAFEGEASRTIIVGRQAWLRPEALPQWQRLTTAEEPFRVRDAFRWTVFASTVRLLHMGPRTAELAFFDYGYPIWYRLSIDRRTGLARETRLVTPENRIRDRYRGFEQPIEIRAPGEG